jgi:predicted nucleic acid-binding protein
MLIDSNIIMYSAQPPYAELRRFIAIHAPAVSAISYVEVLGYHRLIEEHRQRFVQFFRTARVLPLSQAVLDQAVALRRRRKMSLGDVIIAGTALAYDLTLVTRNTEDFQWIDELSLINPLG